MFEIAAYLPKLEKLASSLTRLDQPSSPKSSRRGVSRRASKKSKKIVLVKQPAIHETPRMPCVMPPCPQSGMVFVPASWIKSNITQPRKKRRFVEFPGGHTLASLAKRRHTSVEQNILVQQKPGRTNKTMKKRLALKDVSGKPVMDLAMNVNAKRAALALERKRLEFLHYLREVQDEISAIEFASGHTPTKVRPIKKRDAVTLASRSKKKRTETQQPTGKSKTKTTGALKKKTSKGEHLKNPLKLMTSKVVKSKMSLTSMLSQDSSSTAQIRMMDDAFNSNHRNYKASMNESKQKMINAPPSVTDLPGFFQWNPIPNCRSTNSAIKLS